MKQAFIKLHLSILLAGCTGLFGKLITLNEGLLVWYRVLITSLLFTILLVIWKKFRKISLHDFLRIGGVGALLSLHWLFFYGSIKASNVSIGVVCYSSVGIFTAIFEPLINHRSISRKEILFSLIALFGVVFIFSFDMRYRLGIGLGIISSALAALFTITNKRVSMKHPTSTTLLYEMYGGLLFISLLIPIYLHFFPVVTIIPSQTDCIYLLLFAFFCTICMYILQIQALKKISAFTVNLSYNLEPIYSILLAMLIFGEARDLNASFYIGLSLIIISVIMQMYIVFKDKGTLKT
ncbi:MAG: DMT family transporter [Tannerella sp.]|jgi:drug/metabolite transporter (DMT)-like permease|nr:DMT family transporter [Tannerella sp.]